LIFETPGSRSYGRTRPRLKLRQTSMPFSPSIEMASRSMRGWWGWHGEWTC